MAAAWPAGCSSLPEGSGNLDDLKGATAEFVADWVTHPDPTGADTADGAVGSAAAVQPMNTYIAPPSSWSPGETGTVASCDRYCKEAKCELKWYEKTSRSPTVDGLAALATAAVDTTVGPPIALAIYLWKRRAWVKDKERYMAICMMAEGIEGYEYTVKSRLPLRSARTVPARPDLDE